MALAVGDILQATIAGNHKGQQTRNVLNFRVNDSSKVEYDLAVALAACVTESLIPWISGEWEKEYVHVKKIYPTVGTIAEYNWSPSPGEGLAALPSFNAVVIPFQTAFGGRSGMGRMFLPAVPEDSVTEGVLTDDAYTLILDFVLCMFTKFVGGTTGFDMGVLSRKIKATTPGDPTAWFHNVTHLGIDQQIGSQRSRKIARGI